MQASITLGRPFGIPVGLHWSALLIGALGAWSLVGLFETSVPGYPNGTYWSAAVLAVGLFLGGLVAHELGHAVVARRYGLEVRRITLWALGGVAELGTQPRSPKVELLVALAGPVVSLGVAATLGAVALAADALTDAGVLVVALGWLAFVNVVLGLFNLLPARPLDGGRVLTAVLWWRRGDELAAVDIATRVARVLGAGLAGIGAWQLVTGGFGGLWLLLVAWFVTSAAGAEREVVALRRGLVGVPAHVAMSPPPPSAPGWLTVAQFSSDPGRRNVDPMLLVDATGAAPMGTAPVRRVRQAALARPELLLSDVATPVEPTNLVAAREDLGRRLGERAVSLPLLVVDDGRVVGQIRFPDLQRAAVASPVRASLPPPSGAPVVTGPVPPAGSVQA